MEIILGTKSQQEKNQNHVRFRTPENARQRQGRGSPPMEIDFFIKKVDLPTNFNVVQHGLFSGKSVLICSSTTLLLMIVAPRPRCSRFPLPWTGIFSRSVVELQMRTLFPLNRPRWTTLKLVARSTFLMNKSISTGWTVPLTPNWAKSTLNIKIGGKQSFFVF